MLVPMATKQRKDSAAVRLGRRGGKARLKKMTSEQRYEIARLAARARWANEPVDRSPASRRRQALGLSNAEIAKALGISMERLVAVLNEAGLRLYPKTTKGQRRA